MRYTLQDLTARDTTRGTLLQLQNTRGACRIPRWKFFEKSRSLPSSASVLLLLLVAALPWPRRKVHGKCNTRRCTLRDPTARDDGVQLCIPGLKFFQKCHLPPNSAFASLSLRVAAFLRPGRKGNHGNTTRRCTLGDLTERNPGPIHWRTLPIRGILGMQRRCGMLGTRGKRMVE